jgi:SAM-dependent methyltransferase
MKNKLQWKPSKYTYNKGKLFPTKNTQELGIASRLMATVIARKYQDAIPIYCHGRLLDLGCGKAPFYEAYKDYVTNVELADWPNCLHGNECIDHSIDLTKPIPLPSENYDSIILSDVLEHIPNPEQLLRDIYRLLTGNGVLLLNVPFYYWIHEAPFDYFRYTSYALTRLSESSGFVVESIEPLGGTNEVLADIIAKNIAFLKLPVLGSALIILIQNLALFISSTRLGKRFAEKSAKYFPFGYFVVLRK